MSKKLSSYLKTEKDKLNTKKGVPVIGTSSLQNQNISSKLNNTLKSSCIFIDSSKTIKYDTINSLLLASAESLAYNLSDIEIVTIPYNDNDIIPFGITKKSDIVFLLNKLFLSTEDLRDVFYDRIKYTVKNINDILPKNKHIYLIIFDRICGFNEYEIQK